MSKRGADEYITKENGSTPNGASDASKVKMATAAQLAKRKMAVPKSRAGRTGQSPLPSTGANPFTSTSTFGAPQNNQQQTFSTPGGLTFGASQSFPSGDQPSNGGFTFSVPGQSSSFTFGQPAPNNPFASLNGNTGTQPSQEPVSNDITMESPQKKPAFGSGLFGSNSTGTSAPSTGFSFGQSTSQAPSQPNFGFGQTQASDKPSSPPLFGQVTSKPSESGSTNNLFGQSLPSQSNGTPAFSGFGQKSSETQQDAKPSGFSFGQPSSTPSSMPASTFGQSTTSAPSSTPAFSFGQPAGQVSSNGPLFGGSSQSSQPAFGSSTPAAQSTASKPLFGSSAAGSANNVFGGFGNSKPSEPKTIADTTTSEAPKQTLFGQPSPASAQDQSDSTSADSDQPKNNPFAGLFGQSAQNQSPSTTSSSAETSKPSYNFGASAQPSGLFSMPKSTAEVSKTASGEETPKKPAFSFGAPSTTPSSTLFSSSKSSTEPPVPANPFASLSAQKIGPAEQKAEQSGLGKQNVFQSSPAFGGASSNATPQPATDPTKSKPFRGFGVSGSSHTPAAPPVATPSVHQAATKQTSATPAFGSSTPSKPVNDPFTQAMVSAAAIPPTVPSTPKAVEMSEGPRRSVNTHPPARIPPYLNGDDYKAYDSNYRLHSLNREFQKRIGSLDPSRDDFENIVRNYVAARESIGESIGLYTRNIAGMKRKADDGDDQRGDDSTSTKRNKPASEPSSKPSIGNSSASNSVFQPVPSSASKPPAASMNHSATKSSSHAPSTSSLFSSMIPSNNTSSTDSNNPFAALSKGSNASTNAETPKKPTFSFGNPAAASTAVESTTPTKSPPKKPAFELPKFAPPTGGMNFMAAFQKGSEASAAKFAKEAMEKRKAEEFDSDEDDEEEWNRKYEEEEKAKKAKLSAVAQTGFKPTFGSAPPATKPLFGFGSSTNASASVSKPATSFLFGKPDIGKSPDKAIDISDNDTGVDEDDEDDSAETGDGEDDDADGEEEDDAEDDDLPEDEINGEDENEDEDLETTLAKSRANGKSLFDRITPNPSLQKESTSSSNAVPSIEKETVKQPFAYNNIFGKPTETPAASSVASTGGKEQYVPAKTFNFTPTPPPGATSVPAPGASIFAGGAVKNGPIAGEGLFGSRPSTPSNADQAKSNVFGGLGTPSFGGPADQTWKRGSEIKFGSSTTDAPLVSITEPTPRKDESKPFANLFGANHTGANSSSSPSVGFSFGQSLSSPAPGFLSAASHLTGGSGTNSGLSSRATSPGTTDNESVATNEEDYSNDAQVSLLETHPGEENEEPIFEVRVKASRYYNEEQIKGTKLILGWNGAGLGPARLLKHKETKKTRIVMRAEPGANILLNANLQPNFKYQYSPGKSGGMVKFNVITTDGLQGWTFKTKTQESAQELAKLMEANKAASA